MVWHRGTALDFPAWPHAAKAQAGEVQHEISKYYQSTGKPYATLSTVECSIHGPSKVCPVHCSGHVAEGTSRHLSMVVFHGRQVHHSHCDGYSWRAFAQCWAFIVASLLQCHGVVGIALQRQPSKQVHFGRSTCNCSMILPNPSMCDRAASVKNFLTAG